jgi:hypothetical protein
MKFCLTKTYKNMEQTGILVRKLDERTGVSQRTGNTWRQAEFLLEVPGQYPSHISFTVADGQSGRIAHFEKHIGKTVTVSFDINASEYNGRWYNDLRAWGCKEYVAGNTVQQPQAEASPQEKALEPVATPTAEQTKLKLTKMAEEAASGEEGKGDDDDLPFR